MEYGPAFLDLDLFVRPEHLFIRSSAVAPIAASRKFVMAGVGTNFVTAVGGFGLLEETACPPASCADTAPARQNARAAEAPPDINALILLIVCNPPVTFC